MRLDGLKMSGLALSLGLLCGWLVSSLPTATEEPGGNNGAARSPDSNISTTLSGDRNNETAPGLTRDPALTDSSLSPSVGIEYFTHLLLELDEKEIAESLPSLRKFERQWVLSMLAEVDPRKLLTLVAEHRTKADELQILKALVNLEVETAFDWIVDNGESKRLQQARAFRVFSRWNGSQLIKACIHTTATLNNSESYLSSSKLLLNGLTTKGDVLLLSEGVQILTIDLDTSRAERLLSHASDRMMGLDPEYTANWLLGLEHKNVRDEKIPFALGALARSNPDKVDAILRRLAGEEIYTKCLEVVNRQRN